MKPKHSSLRITSNADSIGAKKLWTHSNEWTCDIVLNDHWWNVLIKNFFVYALDCNLINEIKWTHSVVWKNTRVYAAWEQFEVDAHSMVNFYWKGTSKQHIKRYIFLRRFDDGLYFGWNGFSTTISAAQLIKARIAAVRSIRNNWFRE